ncbi:hypothetical protein GCM10010909_34520 [Acidocella aquatica]|uniref:LUD domain-containing protein n=1 Tax=Acidocella aquatica TaxID=1922313 RepID=A0ABQ6A8G2_9PROT|nr:LUD domain-containing protein [Acidocella aquatica]GLR68770.1 hypothetical protein GCM10010909_34520 [Acidocella aquatica]
MSRNAIIAAIQRGLKRGPLPTDQQAMLTGRLKAHPRGPIPARGQLSLADRIALFTTYAEREFATVQRLAAPAEIPTAIASYLARLHLPPTLTISGHPSLQSIPFNIPSLRIRFGTALPTDPTCLTLAFAGIAETGTLLLPSGPQTPTTNNILPDNSIVLLPAARITASYEDAFDLLRAENPLPRNVMLITGPSRSADIEQTLELGAHGPRRLHILILDGQG